MNQNQGAEPLFKPKLFSLLSSYDKPAFLNDLTSGAIVGIVALPLAIAFGIASGVTPDRGLVTAIIAGFLISLLGGSRVQIGGPTGAFVIIVYQIVQEHGLNGLILCTLMAGAILILMGVFRLGTIIKFIPYPLTVGFTAGIAVVIFSSQIKDFFGLQVEVLPPDFLEKWSVYFGAIDTVRVETLLLSILSLGILVFWPKVSRRIPGSIVAILVVTPLVAIFQIPVETIGSRFGSLPQGLPLPVFPEFHLEQLRVLIGPAFTVAMLCAIESLLSATVADGMIEGRHRPNTELIGQGIANLVTPIFGGIPATGAIARTATNVRNGGRTPIAGIFHSLVLLTIVLVFGSYAEHIPLCVLASILMVVAFHMSERHAIRALLRAPKMDVAVMASTFVLTVFVDLTTAVEVGLLLSAVLFLKRMTEVTTIQQVTLELNRTGEQLLRLEEEEAEVRGGVPPGVEIFEAKGVFFFGVAEALRSTFVRVQDPPKILILRMRHVLALDATGLRALEDLHRSCAKAGTKLILSGIQAQPRKALEHSGLSDRIGPENVHSSIEQALARSRQILAGIFRGAP